MDEKQSPQIDQPAGNRPGPRFAWRSVTVDGRAASYGEGGSGPPVVFLHGWALGQRAYRRALIRLVRRGMAVLAPTLPGFGDTAELPATRRSLEGYAAWVAQFLEAVRADSPVTVVGHSFGGGVGIKLAHDHPELVGGLVLVNSIGGSAWESGGAVRSMAQRPIWDWGIHFPADLWPVGQIRHVLPVVLSESVPNLFRHPSTFVKTADLARKADLTSELGELKRRRLPVVVLWGHRDRIITSASVDSMCAALGGARPVTVDGSHSWLLADPEGFGEVMTNVLDVARTTRTLPRTQPLAESEADSLAGRRRSTRERPAAS